MKPENFFLASGMAEKMELIVTEEQTARYLGSGKSDILATPALVALVEAVAQKIVDRGLAENWQSVGTYIGLKHNSMTPVGRKIRIHVILTDIDEKELTFEIKAFDDSGMIAEGSHKRIISRTEVLKRLLGRKK